MLDDGDWIDGYIYPSGKIQDGGSRLTWYDQLGAVVGPVCHDSLDVPGPVGFDHLDGDLASFRHVRHGFFLALSTSFYRVSVSD